MAEVKIQALKNGPLLVKGETDVLDHEGKAIQSGPQVALCRCGHSSKKPLCDGTHRKVNFEG
jgi:CDGSH-type Zn-finger protein